MKDGCIIYNICISDQRILTNLFVYFVLHGLFYHLLYFFESWSHSFRQNFFFLLKVFFVILGRPKFLSEFLSFFYRVSHVILWIFGERESVKTIRQTISSRLYYPVAVLVSSKIIFHNVEPQAIFTIFDIHSQDKLHKI